MLLGSPTRKRITVERIPTKVLLSTRGGQSFGQDLVTTLMATLQLITPVRVMLRRPLGH